MANAEDAAVAAPFRPMPMVKCPTSLLGMMRAMNVRPAQWLRDVEAGVYKELYHVWWEEIMDQLKRMRCSMDMGLIYHLEGGWATNGLIRR
jgi:hypothetical protein